MQTVGLLSGKSQVRSDMTAQARERREHETKKMADAAAKAGEKGGAYSGAVEVSPGVWVYQITKNGLALQLTLQGTKYYKDDNLNKKS
jgi:hypothetical protein